jgi:sugar (pentulose or hexulose) kinase
MTHREPLFLALDAGSTSFKAILFDADGHTVGHERAEIHLRHPHPLAAEVDAEEWWRAAAELVPRLLARPHFRPQAVAAIGVTGAMHALVPVAADGNVLAPTLTWFDQRCRAQAEALRERWTAAFEAVGGVGVHSSSARLRWLRDTSPAIVEQTHRFLLPKDFLRLRLTGRFATDLSDARSTSMVDRQREDWCRVVLEQALELPVEKLPEILPATEIAGPLTAAAAGALGLRAGTPVAVGMGDVPSTLLGIDAFRSGQLCVYLGTGGWITRTLPADDDALPRTAWIGSTLACGSALNWCRRLLSVAEREGAAPEYAEMEQALASVPPGADGLLFLPHLMGERGRCGDPDARGAFFGLTLAHTPAYLLRAVAEGVVCQIRREIDAAVAAAGGSGPWATSSGAASPPQVSDPVTLSGGAARSAICRQLVADITARRVVVPAVPDSTALGAAMVAAVAIDHFPSLRAAATAWVRPGPTAEPTEPDRSIYAGLYDRFATLETTLASLYAPFAEGIGPANEEHPHTEHLNT